MQPLQFITSVVNGKTTCGKLINDALRVFEGRWVEISIVERRRKRTTGQNALWFVLLEKHAVPLFRNTGANWHVFSVHERIVEELGYVTALVTPKGCVHRERMHTSDFDTKEFSEMIDRAIPHLLIEYGIDMPLRDSWGD